MKIYSSELRSSNLALRIALLLLAALEAFMAFTRRACPEESLEEKARVRFWSYRCRGRTPGKVVLVSA